MQKKQRPQVRLQNVQLEAERAKAGRQRAGGKGKSSGTHRGRKSGSQSTDSHTQSLPGAAGGDDGGCTRHRWVLFRQAQNEKARATAEKKEAVEQRDRAERLSQAAQGGRAKLLTQQPGDFEALLVGLQAIGPAAMAQRDPPPQAVDGLTSAAQARAIRSLLPGDMKSPCKRWPFLPTAAASSPRALTAPLGCGMQRPGPLCLPSRGTPIGCSPRAFLPTAAVSSPRALTAPLGCGMQRPGLFAHPQGHTNWVLAAIFSPSGSRVFTTSSDGTARMWDAKTGASLLTLKGHTNGVRAASFSPMAAASSPRALTAPHGCGMQRPGPLCSPLKGHTNWVLAASFSPDGSRVFTTSSDGTARMWDAKTGASLLTLKGHTNGVRAASFSPDGSRVVTASDDGTARMWDAKTGASLLTLKGHTNWVLATSFFLPTATASSPRAQTAPHGCGMQRPGPPCSPSRGTPIGCSPRAFSPDGSRVATASSDGTARMWDARPGLFAHP